MRELSLINDVLVVDLEDAWMLECPLESSCYLLNEPEGLHPNSAGYDFIADTISSTVVPEPEEEE